MDVPLETIERAKAGNLQAREELLRAFAGPLRALVRRWGNPADPEDQLQELFAKVLRVLPQFEVAGAARLSTWIFTVAHRALLEQRRRPQLNVVPLEQAKQIADQQCIHRALEEGELRRRLEDAIAELPDEQRRVVVLAQIHHQPLEAIAEVEGRAKPDVARALEQFRRLDAALFELEPDVSSESDDRLIHRVVHQRGRSVWLMAAIAAGVAILAAGTAMVLGYGRKAERMSPGTGSAAGPSSTQFLATRNTGASGPLILKAAQGKILLLSGARSQVDKAGALSLEAGGLVVDGRAVVFANGLRFAIDGLAAVTTEPGDAFAHVMQRLQSMPEGKDIQMRLSRWSGPPAVIGTASVALLVASGTAEAQAPDGSPVRIKAGQSWSQTAPGKTLVADSTQSSSRAASDPTEFIRKMNAVSEALKSSVGALTECYKKGLAQNPNLEGSIIADLTLGTGPDGIGQVTAATIAKDYTLASPFVASCALQELSRASVPAPAAGTEVVTVSIYFRRGESGGDPSVNIVSPSVGSAPAAPPPQTAQTVEVGNAPSRGPSNAAVTVVEFTDPECPYCGRAHQSINTLYKELGDRVRFVLKFAPMPFHRRAPGAAAAAFAAGEQGQFFEYVDALYAHPDALDRAGLERMAAQLGLDQKEFGKALDSNRFASAIEADTAQAKTLGVKGVPTFYINGRPLMGARPIDDMRSMILEALNERR